MNKRDCVDWILFWVQLVSVLATVAAAVLAAVTIWRAKVQAKVAQDALIRERRIDFELDVLRELAEYNTRGSSISGALRGFKLRAMMLPADLVPLARAAVDLGSTSQALAERAKIPSEDPDHARTQLQEQIEAEILAAITQRLTERG